MLLDEEAAGSARAVAAELTARVGAERVRVVPSAEWFGESASDQDRLNRLVLGVLTVPASLYALIAVAGTLVMSYSRRGGEIAGMRMVGVSAGQVRRMALWETLSTSLLDVLIAAGVVAVGARAYRGGALGVRWRGTAERGVGDALGAHGGVRARGCRGESGSDGSFASASRRGDGLFPSVGRSVRWPDLARRRLPEQMLTAAE
ncbi:hypothetical protein [Streptomyces koelreuteriae]|uniref:hypothetical protein n=1 Tax=Streptomyces koelreuteriae TaxID=2838015 RepID=UPI003EBA89EE